MINILNAFTRILECGLFLIGIVRAVEVHTEVTGHYQEACHDHVVLRSGDERGHQVTWTAGVLPGDSHKTLFTFFIAPLKKCIFIVKLGCVL